MRAITTMILSMALLALSDMFIKLAAARVPVGQVMLLLSLGGTLLFMLMARLRGMKVLTRQALHPIVLARNGFEIIGGFGIVLGIAMIPLSVFAAIMQAAPLVVTLGAALFLREPVGWRRWAAIAVGLTGMLLVIKPGTEAFAPASLFAVIGVTGLAARDLITRMIPDEIPSLALSTWGFAATIPMGAVLLWVMGDTMTPDVPGLWAISGAVVVTTAGYYGVTTAMRLAPAAIVSPFRYSRLVFTMGLGVLVFGERPDATTLTGAAIVIAAGLYTFLRERRLARQGQAR
ncbi:DMT family transporter [Aestuariicoccus sp. MJ-SS9]|uniref:DMT family transporter n=1 Tax=Aestuariicoccus sp. MJ-SS9 TaxID=3079855 RepID=UPI00290CC458|nr:DMT family transporter [Aestuariicoccus sp. MJ-SS9]MDU8913184.1 DMT family transporter [Aestuariicoccus sp. MJ-SS9]